MSKPLLERKPYERKYTALDIVLAVCATIIIIMLIVVFLDGEFRDSICKRLHGDRFIFTTGNFSQDDFMCAEKGAVEIEHNRRLGEAWNTSILGRAEIFLTESFKYLLV